jgi:hypothetical protein
VITLQKKQKLKESGGVCVCVCVCVFSFTFHFEFNFIQKRETIEGVVNIICFISFTFHIFKIEFGHGNN